MSEDFLHYIWRCGLYDQRSLRDNFGNVIEVIRCGVLNDNAGPDFFNAMVRVDGTVFAGNVEIHINSSDWYRHGHHWDRAYDTVILQVVLNRDAEVRRTGGEIIPTAVISYDERLLVNYRQLLNSDSLIACRQFTSQVDPVQIRQWLDNLSLARLEGRAVIIREIRHHNNNCWEETLYQQLARNFGFGLNGAVFEMLARSLPYKYLLRHRDNLFQLEALLFGQAGMLIDGMGTPAGAMKMTDFCGNDDYFGALKREYSFLKSKYGLKPFAKHLWRFLRLRPSNFPTIRLAQFAAFIHKKPSLFSEVIDSADINSLSNIFRVSASEYWESHFMFGRPSVRSVKKLGVFAIRSIVINTVVPLLYFYGKQRNIAEYVRRARDFLIKLPPENNSIIRKWSELGVRAENACNSQALIHLNNEFCLHRRCLECSIGSKIVNMHLEF